MLVTFASGEHVGIDPTTGETTPLPMFTGQNVLWQVSTGGPRGTYAVQATGDGDHNVLVFNRLDEIVARLPGTPLPLAMRWDPAGTKLVYAIDDSTDRTTLIVYDAQTGTTIETSFPEDPLHPETVGIIVE
jgi:DNA-binding beta-propeller fold protein YncE